MAFLYSSDWSRKSNELKKKFPLCLDPLGLHKGQLKPSEEIHHNLKLARHPKLELTDSNLVPVCKPCHEALERLCNRSLILAPSFLKKLKEEFLEEELPEVPQIVYEEMAKYQYAQIVKENCHKVSEGNFYCKRRQLIVKNPCPGVCKSFIIKDI